MPATTFYELLKRDEAPTGCGVLVVQDGKILTGTRIERASRGQICGPGGHIEAGETPEEADRREAHEEFGITCHDLTPLGVQDGGRHGRSAVFLCRSFSETPQTDEEEMTAPKWLSPEEIKGNENFPPFLQSLELITEQLNKSERGDEMEPFTIFKADDDKHLVFGWASVAITVNGEELEDRQHDVIDPDEMEEAAYEYVLNFRDTGEEHLPGYRKKGKLVESCVFTKDKQKAMGIPEGILPVAWWIGFKIEDEDTWRRIKDGTYKMFSIEGKANREPIEKANRNFGDFPGYWEWLEENLDSSTEDQKAAEKYYGGKTHKTIAKSFDELIKENVEIDKFNPFHDSLGRFSSSHGMKTYSANPKTKAGQMAIGRSAAAGYGYTMNVHRESKGENIKQNDNWIKTGRKPRVPAAQSATLQQRAARGTRSKVTTGQQQNKPAATKPAQPKQPASQQQTNQTQQSTQTRGLAQSLANVTVTSAQKLALQPRNTSNKVVSTKKVANDHDQDRVAGKDVSKSFKVDNNSTKSPIDQIAEAQGWNKAPTVTNDRDLFNKAAVQSGRVMMRTVNGYGGKTGDQVCNETMTKGDTPLGGSGGKVYGTGMYLVDTSIKGSSNIAKRVASGQQESGWYGNKQMMATVHPNAKIATPTQAAKLTLEYNRLSRTDKARFGYDTNTYIASKGYDGAKWHNDSDPTAYTTVFNKSALIFFGGVADTR